MHLFHYSDPANGLVGNKSRSHTLQKIDGVRRAESFIAVSMVASGSVVIKKVKDVVKRGN